MDRGGSGRRAPQRWFHARAAAVVPKAIRSTIRDYLEDSGTYVFAGRLAEGGRAAAVIGGGTKLDAEGTPLRTRGRHCCCGI